MTARWSDPHRLPGVVTRVLLELISEAARGKYSRRLSERITEGYAAKVDQEHDPGGHAGLGFRRLPEPPHTLGIDPDRMPIAVGLFERYALGNVSATQLEAESGLAATRIRMILARMPYLFEYRLRGWRLVQYVDQECVMREPFGRRLDVRRPLGAWVTHQPEPAQRYRPPRGIRR